MRKKFSAARRVLDNSAEFAFFALMVIPNGVEEPCACVATRRGAYLWQAPGLEKVLRSASFAVVRFNDCSPCRKHLIPRRFLGLALQDIENPSFACCDPHQALGALAQDGGVAMDNQIPDKDWAALAKELFLS